MSAPLKILAFAYVFPPDAGSGTYRTLYFANQWARLGDEVTVVTVRTEDFAPSAIVDHGLTAQIERSIKVVRASAARPLQAALNIRARLRPEKRASAPQTAGSERATEPARQAQRRTRSLAGRLIDWVSALLTFPDEHSGWILYAVYRGYAIVRRMRPDCIYASGGPWSGIAAATLLHRLTRIPLFLDFRDPWSSSPNLISRSRSARASHRWLEAYCVRRASCVIANTDELRRDFVRRYADIPQDTFVCVTNGFEETTAAASPSRERFYIVHAGELYLSRNPLNFLSALAQLVRSSEIPRDAIRVRFVGGIALRSPEIEAVLAELREVVEIIPRVPHEEALRLQHEASALLLFQKGLPLQVPRKLYEYLSLKLPILAITESDSATGRILTDVDLGHVVDDDPAQIATALRALYCDWKERIAPRINQDRLSAYGNRHLAGQLRAQMLTRLRGPAVPGA